MGGTLTVSERILYHLQSYIKYEDKYDVPFDVTQDGISQACSISRAHAAIELKKLKMSRIVDERLSHVRRGKTRRKVYFLTPEGKAKAAVVVQYAKENGIETLVDPSKILPELTSGRAKPSRRSSPMPSVKVFLGREKELESLRRAMASPEIKIVAVKGIAGIGKTTLVAKLASELTAMRVYWYSSKSWDSPKTLAESLGRFFQDNGSRRLGIYLSSGRFDLGELSFLLREELSENGYAFVFDDVDSSSGLADFLKMFRHSSGTAKVVVTSEGSPGFYDNSDVVARKDVFELELQGLDEASAMKLLETRGITGEVASELSRITHGHPLSLEMVTETRPEGAKYQVSKFFEERFYAGLTENAKCLLQLSSVFVRPFTVDAIPKELRQARKGSILREVAPGKFEIHDSLRNFVYDSMTKDEKTGWHSVAADYYLREGDAQERLYHLIHANRLLEAEMHVARMGEELLGDGNVRRLWTLIGSFEPSKPKFRPAVTMVKARAASMAGEYVASWSMLEGLAKDSNAPSKAEALVEMGRIKSKKGEFGAALKLFAEALENAKELPAIRAKALRGLGVVEGKLGNYSKAQELLERSAQDALSVMDQKGMLLAHLELGNVFIGRGDYEQAIDHFSKCAAGFGPVELTNVYVNMGIACAHLGRNDDARLHLENAVRLSDETGQPRSKAYALTSLAEVLIRSSSLEQAKEHCFSALEIFTELDERLGISAAYANLGMAERMAGNLVVSEEYYGESLKALDGMDVPWGLGVRKMEFGLMLADKGEEIRALALIEDSRRLFQAIDANGMLEKADEALRRVSQNHKLDKR
jgi:tetratricopeptide (TPR) repeat protein